jgi:acylphosphatase
MTIRKHFRAHGHVQGVFFRDTVRREALRRGVTGWARNCSDGTVEGVFEGPEWSVGELLDLCRAGPGRAFVTKLDVVDEDVEGLDGFATG